MLIILLCLAILSQPGLGLSVSIPLVAPPAAVRVSSSLFSFSIEQDRWTDWAGSTSRNQFLFNTLDNLGQLTGAPPRIRIGANSEDHTKFNPAIKVSSEPFKQDVLMTVLSKRNWFSPPALQLSHILKPPTSPLEIRSTKRHNFFLQVSLEHFLYTFRCSFHRRHSRNVGSQLRTVQFDNCFSRGKIHCQSVQFICHPECRNRSRRDRDW